MPNRHGACVRPRGCAPGSLASWRFARLEFALVLGHAVRPVSRGLPRIQRFPPCVIDVCFSHSRRSHDPVDFRVYEYCRFLRRWLALPLFRNLFFWMYGLVFELITCSSCILRLSHSAIRAFIQRLRLWKGNVASKKLASWLSRARPSFQLPFPATWWARFDNHRLLIEGRRFADSFPDLSASHSLLWLIHRSGSD